MRPIGGGLPFKYGTTWLDNWNSAKNRIERTVTPNGSNWFVWDADPADCAIYRFQGVDWGADQYIHGAGQPLRTASVGLGSAINSISALGGGMEMLAFAVAANYILYATAATPLGNSYIYTAAGSEPWYYIRFKLPNAGDLLDHYVFFGLYAGATDYMGMIFDISVDANWRFVTRRAAGTTSNIAIAADNLWHTLFMHATAGQVDFCLDNLAMVSHTTNITALQLTNYCMNQTGVAGGANHYFHIHEMRVIADAQ